MINDKKVVALIPARGGSKGIKNKNIIDLCGKPLISYTITAALNSLYIDDVIVSTDSDRIASISKKYGAEVPFIRPDYLASDTAKTIDVVIHAISFLEENGRLFDILVLLQPTSPLRTTEDIDKAIERFCVCDDDLVSVSLVKDHPLLIRTIENDRLKRIMNTSSTCRRQDMPAFYRVNGSIYVNKIVSINELTSFNDNPAYYIMDDSHAVDIDDWSDIFIAEYYLKN